MTIQAYIDESGCKGQNKILAFAGFIGEAEEWARFSGLWVACLSNAPAISYFRMNEAAKLEGQFARWKQRARDEKLRELARVINAVRVRCIHYAIDLPAFEKGMAEHWVKPLSNPYFLGFTRMLAGVCVDVLDWGHKEQIEIIFDHHIIFAPRVRLWYPLWKEMWDVDYPELAAIYPTEPLFRDDKEFVPLQAADMMAWLFRRDYEHKSQKFAWIVSELKDTQTSHCSDFVGKEKMAELVKMSYEFDKRITPQHVKRWHKHLGFKTGAGKG